MELIETPQVIGYKLWGLDYNWDITSQDDCVVEGEAAKCIRGKLYETYHRSPDLNCTCGYYYTKSQEWLLRYCGNNISPARNLFEIALYGKIVECEYGGRAEYFKILRVIIPIRKYNLMDKPEKYPVVILPDLPKRKFVAKTAEEWIEEAKHGSRQTIASN